MLIIIRFKIGVDEKTLYFSVITIQYLYPIFIMSNGVIILLSLSPLSI